VRISDEIIGLAKRVETLKRVGRSGWALAGVDNVRLESVGEHSFGTIMISLLISKALGDEGYPVDLSRVVELAAIHDLPESTTSDIPRIPQEYGGEILREGKRDIEKQVINLISKKYESFAAWLVSLWRAFSDGKSFETRIVLAADIIDMLVHANTLETTGVSPLILDQFFVNSYPTIKKLELEIADEIFLKLYSEHAKNADKLGIKLKQIVRK
jgi:5'-deoxynucleotidase YfbR-like HD superfamily hydrolase